MEGNLPQTLILSQFYQITWVKYKISQRVQHTVQESQNNRTYCETPQSWGRNLFSLQNSLTI